jgi:methyl-accepting chemotaxis protein
LPLAETSTLLPLLPNRQRFRAYARVPGAFKGASSRVYARERCLFRDLSVDVETPYAMAGAQVRKEAKDDRVKIRQEVDGHVFKLMDNIRQRVTREEFDNEQNYFHSQMTHWVVEELDQSRRSMLEKINRLQTRMAQELEDLTQIAGVEECVAKVQEITSAVGEMSESLYDHKEAIDRNADKLLELGANSAQVAEIREGFEELKKKTQSTLMMIRSKVQKQMDSQVDICRLVSPVPLVRS